jgi:hypothetical protein
MVNYLINKLSINRLILVTKINNAPSVRDLYSETPQVELAIFNPDTIDELIFSSALSSQSGIPLLKVTFKGAGAFDEYFYHSLGIPFEARWSHFKLPKDLTRPQEFYKSKNIQGPYCLIANSSSIGRFPLKINSSLPQIYVASESESILDWIEVIKNADEIHCVDSSFIHLCDSLDIKSKKLFYHDVGKAPETYFNLQHSWSRLSYL